MSDASWRYARHSSNSGFPQMVHFSGRGGSTGLDDCVAAAHISAGSSLMLGSSGRHSKVGMRVSGRGPGDVLLPEGADHPGLDVGKAEPVLADVSLIREIVAAERLPAVPKLIREDPAPLLLVSLETVPPVPH